MSSSPSSLLSLSLSFSDEEEDERESSLPHPSCTVGLPTLFCFFFFVLSHVSYRATSLARTKRRMLPAL